MTSPRSVTSARTILHERPRTTVYLDAGGDRPTVIKVLNDPQPTLDELARFQRDLSITRDLDIPGVRRAVRKDRVGERHALVVEHAPGRPLTPRVVRGESDVRDFLHTALAITRVLGDVHDRDVVHKDIRPAHLIHDPISGTVTLIDFGIASRLELAVADAGRPELIEGTLAYISPEQTGRTSRVVDWRSDLYSLGATFYELLTGRPPWTLDDAGELVHAHLARTPTRADVVNPAVPQPIADIVDKLLAKDAEDRYQSASGLAYDLEQCLASLERDGRIESFSLASKDASGRLRFPPRLYGREREAAALLDAFGRIRLGSRELALVAGDPGVGKSSVVHELDRPIAERAGLFIEGKFDQLRRSVPYSALEQAFRQLVDTLLTEPHAAFTRWRETITNALGASSAALLPLVPSLERILGPLPALGDASSEEVQNRFRIATQAFVRAVSSAERPLVLFLDDLQWADIASLEVLRWILTDRGGAHVLVIGTYRDNEVPSGHPLNELLRATAAAQVPTHTLRLDDLALSNVESLVTDTLRVPASEAAELAALVHAKTRGNPFFVRRFIQSLNDDGHLRFEKAALRWRWDVASIASLNITDNVVELVAAQLGRLPDETRAAVQTASCIGGRFDLSLLSAATGRSPEELRLALWPAVSAGFLTPRDREEWSYGFVHDRVRQAAYDALDEGVRTAAHLEIGRSLLARTPPEHRDERLFEIVNHLDLAASLIHDASERRMLAELNLAAGRRAAASAAYEPACRYLSAALPLLGENAWSTEYELTLAVQSALGEASYLSGALEDADRACDVVVRNARTALDAVTARDTRVMVAYARDRQDLVIEHGLEALRELGIRFPSSPTMASIVVDLGRTKFALRGRVIESLAELPVMTDARMIAAMQMIERMIPAAFRSGSKLFPLLVFRLVRLSLRHGNSPVSAFGYSTYAISLCGVLGDYEAGYRFSLVGQRVAERFNAPAFRAKALFVFGNFVRHWREPLGESIEPLAQSWRFGMESGAQFEAIWATFYRLLWLLQLGRDLPELEGDIVAMEGLLAQDAGAGDAGRLLRQAVANLSARDGSQTEARLSGPYYDEATMQARHAEATDQTHLCFYHAIKLQLAVWFGAVDEARHHADEAERRIESVTSMPYVPIIRFYAALAALDALRANPTDRALDRVAAKRSRLLAKWARRSPANYRHKHLLIEAERARVAGKAAEARERFDAALTAAKASGLVQEEALVLERAGAFYQSLGQTLLASALINEAARAWRHWGAHAKVAQLERVYPSLVARDHEARGSGASSNHGNAAGTAASVLDLAAMTKAAGAISGVGDRLLERLVSVAVESAGATRGTLITARGDELIVAAVEDPASAAGHAEVVNQRLDDSARVCDSAVLLAARTFQALVVADARTDARFRDHPWIKSSETRALLCVPIILRQQLGGVLYLENTTPGSFTPDRVEVLTVLGGEAAIALENARLFDAQLRLTEAQRRFVPHEFLRSLDRTDIAEVQLGDAIEKTMSVLFADMRGFSTLIEGMTPAESIQFINAYLGEMEPSITKYGGFVDEYQGDGILALFDANPDDAVRGALDMLVRLGAMNERRHRSGHAPIHIGIGINTGRLILGTIGGERHLKAAVVGDTVNLSARIESLTKTYDVRLLVGGELVASLARPSDFSLRAIDTVRVVGRATPVTLYEVFDADPVAQREKKRALMPRWETAVACYRSRDFAGGRAKALEYLAELPGDVAAQTLFARCEKYIAEPPPEEWTGVESLQRK